MINTQNSIVETFRDEIDKEIDARKSQLVDRTTEREAGFIQGMIAVRGMLDGIIQKRNDHRANPRL